MLRPISICVALGLAALPLTAMACGTTGLSKTVPGEGVARAMREGHLTARQMSDAGSANADIDQFVHRGEMDRAQTAEAEAMDRLGYVKLYLRCGPGVYVWTKRTVKGS